MEELEGKGQAAYSEGITDTVFNVVNEIDKVTRVNSLTCIFGDERGTRGRGKWVEVRVQRRVRMGKKDKVGLPYILSPSLVT